MQNQSSHDLLRHWFFFVFYFIENFRILPEIHVCQDSAWSSTLSLHWQCSTIFFLDIQGTLFRVEMVQERFPLADIFCTLTIKAPVTSTSFTRTGEDPWSHLFHCPSSPPKFCIFFILRVFLYFFFHFPIGFLDHWFFALCILIGHKLRVLCIGKICVSVIGSPSSLNRAENPYFSYYLVERVSLPESLLITRLSTTNDVATGR